MTFIDTIVGLQCKNIFFFPFFPSRLVKMTEIKMTEKRRPKERTVNITFRVWPKFRTVNITFIWVWPKVWINEGEHTICNVYSSHFQSNSMSKKVMFTAVWAQHWHFCSMLKRYVNIALIGLILSNQCWHIFSTLSKNVNVEIRYWAQTAMLKLNIAYLITGVYQP